MGEKAKPYGKYIIIFAVMFTISIGLRVIRSGSESVDVDFDSWYSYRLGSIVMPVPTDDFDKERFEVFFDGFDVGEFATGSNTHVVFVEGFDLEVYFIESRTGTKRVVGFQYVDMVSNIKDMSLMEFIGGVTDDNYFDAVLRSGLRGAVEGAFVDFIQQTDGEKYGESEGEMSGHKYYGFYGVSGGIPVVMRGFIYDDDLYVVLLQIRGGSDEQMEEFFRRIKIGE